MPNTAPTVIPTSTDLLFGLDIKTVITAIVVPFILTIIGIGFSRKKRDKLRVRVVSKLNQKQFEELSSLYCHRVPDYERVPPNHFQAFFQQKLSAKSIRNFRHRIHLAANPVHLLIVTRSPEGICGFLKAIFIPDIRCLFIAYLVTAPPTGKDERIIVQRLVSLLYMACRRTVIESIVYEICVEPKSSHKAKARLFRHYATSLGVKFRLIAAKYQQPEICSFDAGDCKLTNAELYIAYLSEKGQEACHTITQKEYKNIVSAIYRDVYLMSYALAEPQLTNKYKDFLQGVIRSLFAVETSKTIELK
ncbi:MAG: hypothetical protein WCI23_11385 [Chlorobiaceae bacterium]